MSESENMASNLRQKERIDYKTLNDSGQVKLKPSCLNTNMPSSVHLNQVEDVTEMSQQLNELSLSNTLDKKASQPEIDTRTDLKFLKSTYGVLKEEIEDYIDENPTNQTIVSIDDIESCIEKITVLRTQFRQTVKQIEASVDREQFNYQFNDEISSLYASIKEYIINAKDRKSEIRMQDKKIIDLNSAIKLKKDNEENSQRKRATDFLINEVNRISNELSEEFEKECDGQVTTRFLGVKKISLQIY